MGRTAIEWATHTENDQAGCTKVSPACKFCYAEYTSVRINNIGSAWRYDRVTTGSLKNPKWTGKVVCDHARRKAKFDEIRRARKVRRTFYGSMTDLWHESLEIDGPTLTLLAEEVESLRTGCKVPTQVVMFLTKRPERLLEWQQHHFPSGLPPQVWVGTTAEDQEWADKRIPYLIQVEADVRYLSCEPMVGEVYLRPEWLVEGLEWVICGGESGNRARRDTAEPSWFRSLMWQCDKAKIPFFFKQWGAHNEVGTKVGKKDAGCDLDGSERKESPGTSGLFRRSFWKKKREAARAASYKARKP